MPNRKLSIEEINASIYTPEEKNKRIVEEISDVIRNKWNGTYNECPAFGFIVGIMKKYGAL